MNGERNNVGHPAQRGGLNFWQWLGIAIIVIAAAIYVYRNFLRAQPTPQQTPNQSAPTQAQEASPPSPDASEEPELVPTRRPRESDEQ